MKRWMLGAAMAASLVTPPAAAAAPPNPFGHACVPQNGVRFCPTVELTDRVASWDGTPLDVDVTLPPTGDGPFPTLVIEHDFPGGKATYQATTPDGDGGRSYHYNNVFYAQQGYAVVTASARGFGRSCGVPTSRTAGCERGWTHIADHRFEDRDVQHLLGRLVDQRVARADALGVTGLSGGGGRTIGLAFLRDRIRRPDGGFAPWRSPAGTPLRIAAAFPRWGWSDLSNALVPNGRLRERSDSRSRLARTPIGVPKENWIDLLYLGGSAGGYIAPPGADPQADLTAWRARTEAGEPFGADVRRIVDVLSTYIGGDAGLSASTAAPMLIENGWTDDLFPADEALRIYRRMSSFRGSTVNLVLGDLGHSRGGNSVAVDRDFNDRGARFLAHYLKREGRAPRRGAVRVRVSACPKGTAGRAIDGGSWSGLQRGRVVVRSERAQSFDQRGGSTSVAQAVGGPSANDPCTRVPSRRERSSATAEGTSRGFTLLGAPVVEARIRTRGRYGQVAARLWDVSNGRQRLVSRGAYRLNRNQAGTIRFELHPNAYRFGRGHRFRLELLGADSPYLQAADSRFSVAVSRLRLALPTNDRPSRERGIVR